MKNTCFCFLNPSPMDMQMLIPLGIHIFLQRTYDDNEICANCCLMYKIIFMHFELLWKNTWNMGNLWRKHIFSYILDTGKLKIYHQKKHWTFLYKGIITSIKAGRSCWIIFWWSHLFKFNVIIAIKFQDAFSEDEHSNHSTLHFFSKTLFVKVF